MYPKSRHGSTFSRTNKASPPYPASSRIAFLRDVKRYPKVIKRIYDDLPALLAHFLLSFSSSSSSSSPLSSLASLFTSSFSSLPSSSYPLLLPPFNLPFLPFFRIFSQPISKRDERYSSLTLTTTRKCYRSRYYRDFRLITGRTEIDR